jgi:2-polyprenyl-3-methyl-5-hydroxy-6-metoxy-1,4-benzoquinol methylase
MSNGFENSLEKIAHDYHMNNNDKTKIFDHLFHLMLAEKLNKMDSIASRILELGYGEGTISQKLLNDNFKRRTLIEGSAELARKAKIELGEEITVINSMFEEYNPQEKYDLVIASNILEHVYDPIKVLKKIKGWLTKKGRCIITVPNSESFHRRLAKSAGFIKDTKELSKRDAIVGHLRVYDLVSLTDDVKKSGLQVLKVEGMVLKFLDNESQLKINPEIIKALHNLSVHYPAEFCANIYMEVQL